MQLSGTLWLVGMMGAGKSAVGRTLAARLGLPFADTDGEVERDAGDSVRGIFGREGEGGFRAREREAMARWAGKPAVIALGGGAVAQPGTPEWLARTGTVVWLRARPETLLARLGEAAERPLLEGLDPEARRARLEALLDARRAQYARAALVVDTDGRSVEEVAETVLELLETTSS